MVSSILASTLVGLACLAAIIPAAPLNFPTQLTGSFPKITIPSPELTATETTAQGTLPGPNGKPPTGLKSDTLTILQLIAFNEMSEVAFFTQLLQNITSSAPGYTEADMPSSVSRDAIIASITTVIAQEELHALNALGGLNANDPAKVVQPCTYSFPVSTFTEAISLAVTFTDVVMGTLGAAQSALAANGDVGLIPRVASVIGQEGEQVGGFRALLGKVPSELPFLTASHPLFAFSALNQGFVRDCPNSQYTVGQPADAGAVQGINIPILGGMTSSPANPDARAQTIHFTATLKQSDIDAAGSDLAGTFALSYVNQQNAPVTVAISGVEVEENVLSFDALFPFDEATKGAFFGNGLTIGVVTKTGDVGFSTAADVAGAAVAGPVLFTVN